MKKQLLIAIFLCFSIGLQSQVLISLLFGDKLNSDGMEFGLEGGVTYSSLGSIESNDKESNFYLGFYFDVRIKDQWSLDTGIMVKTTLGNDDLSENDLDFLNIPYADDDGDGTYTQKIGYFILPALIKYKFDNHIYLEAGPQFGLVTKSWVEYNYKFEGKSGRIKQTNTDMMNRFDMGATVGAGFRLLKGLGWTIGAKYYYGFLDVYKDLSGSNNSTLFLKMNIPIGLSEKSKIAIQDQKKVKDDKKEQKKLEKQKRKEEEKKD